MKHYDENIIRLIQLYLAGDISGGERVKLEEWIKQHPSRKEWFEQLCSGEAVARDFPVFERMNTLTAWNNVAKRSGFEVKTKHRRLNWYLKIAAIAVPFMILASGYFIHILGGEELKIEVAEITPGKSKALLRLHDNREIELAGINKKNLNVAKDIVARNDASGIVYPSQVATGKTEYNVLEIPRGGEYTITLSDGTVVYLNSGSELRYPVAFSHDTRAVYLSGEAYFEVKKDVNRPFIVNIEGLKIHVYGTSFNVNTYNTRGIETILVEGNIGIQENKTGVEHAVKPGQLALYDRQTGTMKLRKVDVRPYVAWKDQEFMFDNESLEDIMNTLSLWYDVDVFFQTTSLKQLHFTGHLGRYEDISHILNAISGVTRVKFAVQGRTIMVME